MKLNVFVVSAQAYRVAPADMADALASLGFRHERLTLKVDASALGKPAPAGPRLRAASAVMLGELVREEGGDYQPDERAISGLLKLRQADELVLVDAHAFQLEVLGAVLAHMRRVLFAEPTWPGAIAIVVRDELLNSASAWALCTFYLPPSRKSIREAASYACRVHQLATLARVFNWSQATTERVYVLMQHYLGRLHRVLGRDVVDLT